LQICGASHRFASF